eukprot:CAMPEP_0171469230 /NCGR_PEP_ID=MMETSP0945-20130129/11162_1 /TAXON_ID=109269 /ORGANISM="Vaucheria litorea, Strain CCMP2940" /LENGTH=121 /DNA_ID=CAMNT_0011998337 /DNA_START=9 /DNA_END=371 /DNA_ORIENTATION=+
MTKGFGNVTNKIKKTKYGAGKSEKSINQQMSQFEKLKKSGGDIYDLYVNVEGEEIFYFTGKISTLSGNVAEAIKMQKALATEYIRTIVPTLPFKLQFFYALGNSEISVAKNEMGLTKASPN